MATLTAEDGGNVMIKEAIIKLSSTLETAKTELSKFKGFWKSLIKRFQMKIFDEKYYDRIGNNSMVYGDPRNFTLGMKYTF